MRPRPEPVQAGGAEAVNGNTHHALRFPTLPGMGVGAYGEAEDPVSFISITGHKSTLG
jgi:hypothetical protein